MSSKNLGAQGELLVARVLEQRGHRILVRNWRTRWWEIDFISKFGQEVWVVEVKTRSSEQFGRPEAAVHPAKVRKLHSAARVVVASWPQAKVIRCVVASVLLRPKISIQFIHIPAI